MRRKKLSPKDLKPASYNPRTMDSETKEALKVSMKEFNDISGITWNKTTKNIVTGHHRWVNLLDIYGEENLDFEPIGNGFFFIINKENNTPTGFILREVEWDEIKEKAANVAGNAKTLMGEFTIDLKDVLEDIQSSLGHVYDNLNFGDLRFDNVFENNESDPIFNKDDWSSDIGKVEKTNSDNREMFETITITFQVGLSDDIKILVKEALQDFNVTIK